MGTENFNVTDKHDSFKDRAIHNEAIHPIIEIKMSKDIKEIDLATYEEILKDAVANESEALIPNSDKYHAAVAMSVIFDNTESEICLVVNSFSGEVSNDSKYVNSIENCVKRGVKFNVLTLNKPNEESKGYQVLLAYKNSGGKISINQATPESISILKSRMTSTLDFGEPHNFILSDSHKYRLEFYPTKFMALLSFNDKGFVSKYKSTFESAFKAGTAI